MRKLLMCLAVTAVCGVLSATSSHAIPSTCVFRCCDLGDGPTTPCVNGTMATTCGAWKQTHACP